MSQDEDRQLRLLIGMWSAINAHWKREARFWKYSAIVFELLALIESYFIWRLS